MKLNYSATKKKSLKRKLFSYMFILALLLFCLLLAGVFLIGNFTGTKQRVFNSLKVESEHFERQIDTYYDSLAVMSVQLSETTTEILENYLCENNITFNNISGSQKHIENLQNNLITSLRQKLWEADCTGTFVMLEAKVNKNVQNSYNSRTGIYLQRNSLEPSDTRVLLYRGLSKIGKDHDCMPHRKWRLEFSTDLFPNYTELKSSAEFPLDISYRITDVVLLPGTDQHVMLMTVPLLSENGTFYGICGFELNEGYFKHIFAQPSQLDHTIFCISKSDKSVDLSESTTLSAGVLNKYYLEPRASFLTKDFGKGLTEYYGKDQSYIGITKNVKLCPGNCNSAISVIIPKQDYSNMLWADTLRIILLVFAFSIAIIAFSFLFARQYLKPVKNALDSIRKKEYRQNTAYYSEINDLFVFLAEQDRIAELELNKLKKEKYDAVNTANQMKNLALETEKQNKRLAYSRKEEIDPYDYENFKNGIKTLTKKEKEVLNFYMQGKTVKEIINTLGLQESTVRFHNKNIYSKLGVHSLKQLLRYAAVLQQEQKEK